MARHGRRRAQHRRAAARHARAPHRRRGRAGAPNGNLRGVFQHEFRSLDDDTRRRLARIDRVTMAEWVHLLCEVRPGLTDDEARAAVLMVDGMLRSVSSMHTECGPGAPRAGDEGHGDGRAAGARRRPARRAGGTWHPSGIRRGLSRAVRRRRRAGVPNRGPRVPRGDPPPQGHAGAHRVGRAGRVGRDARQGLPAAPRRRRLRRDHLAARVRRPRAAGALPAALRPRSDGVPDAAARARDRARHVRPDDPRARDRGAEARVDPAAAARRARVVRAVQRTGCRLRPRERADARDARRRRRGSSTARRCGRRARSTATTRPASRAPIPTVPSAKASRCSSSTCTRPASPSGRCAR